MSQQQQDIVNETLRQLEEDILAQGETKPAKPKKPAGTSYDVFNSLKNAESGKPDRRATGVDQLLSSMLDSNRNSDVMSVQLTLARPYGSLVLARVMPAPGTPIVKKLVKLRGGAPLKVPTEKVKASKDFVVFMRKSGEKKSKVAEVTAKDKSKSKPKPAKAPKKTVAGESTPRARIMANLDKLSKKSLPQQQQQVEQFV